MTTSTTNQPFRSLVHGLNMLCNSMVPYGICTWVWENEPAGHLAIMAAGSDPRQLVRFEIEKQCQSDGKVITVVRIRCYNEDMAETSLDVVSPLSRICGFRIEIALEDMDE